MTRLTSLFTFICYFIVTFLEKGAIILCVLVSCGISEPVEDEPVQVTCGSCCESQSACGSVVSSEPAPIKVIEEIFCQIFMETSESIKRQCDCQLTKPSLMATYEPLNSDNYKPNTNQSEKTYCFCDSSANLLADQSRPRGIHHIILTTVLLI
ncbi:MAG: hypothetical protein GY865_16090 [candidate division Zixibacteria bacterium]|nr:hypothetical protein [candidate division Zixibacteria bacterium]